jgi:GNAT superfamily N-acetyltransferase
MALMMRPDYQRRGIGLNLLNMVIKRVKSDGIKMVNVIFEPRLEKFYKKANFVIMSAGLIDNEKL